MSIPLVYLISDSTAIKIGSSNTEAISERIRCLQTGNPRKLYIQYVILYQRYELEFWLHERFSLVRLEGEWFNARSEFILKTAKQFSTDVKNHIYAWPCEIEG